jgi:hypothetical protein
MSGELMVKEFALKEANLTWDLLNLIAVNNRTKGAKWQ